MPTKGAAPPRKRSVFLNLPFDENHESLLVSLVVGVTGLGLLPRTVLEIRENENRLTKIYRLIGDCAFSVHDLSEVRLGGGLHKCPRFNMPFELGLAVAQQLSSRNHRWCVLETRRYRLQTSLSDLNGWDPQIRRPGIRGTFAVLRNVLDRPSWNPPPEGFVKIYNLLRPEVLRIREENQNSLFSANAYSELVVRALVTAKKVFGPGF